MAPSSTAYLAIIAALLALASTAHAIQPTTAMEYEIPFDVIVHNTVNATQLVLSRPFIFTPDNTSGLSEDSIEVTVSAACDHFVCSSKGACTAEARAAFIAALIADASLGAVPSLIQTAVSSQMTAMSVNWITGSCECKDTALSGFCQERDNCGVVGGDGSSCCPDFSQAQSDGTCVCQGSLVMKTATIYFGASTYSKEICCQDDGNLQLYCANSTAAYSTCHCSFPCLTTQQYLSELNECSAPVCAVGGCPSSLAWWWEIQSISGPSQDYHFGDTVKLSSDGQYLAVGGHDSTYAAQSGAIKTYIDDGSYSFYEAYTLYDSSSPVAGELLGSGGKSIAYASPYDTYLLAGAPHDNSTAEPYAQSGCVHVYVSYSGYFSELYTLLPFDGSDGDLFGSTIVASADGMTVLIGAPGDSDGGSGSGGVYYYTYNSSSSTYEFAQKMVPMELTPSGQLGSSLAFGDTTGMIAMGAPGDDGVATDAGAVYVYTTAANYTVTFLQKLVADDASSGDSFGAAVAISIDGDILVVGAPFAGAVGAVYTFYWKLEDYQQLQKLQPSNGADLGFGSALRMSADGMVMVVGAEGQEGMTDVSGAAYIYGYSASGTYVMQKRASTDSCNVPDRSRFGSSLDVSADGTTVVVGATGESTIAGLSTGAVYLYKQMLFPISLYGSYPLFSGSDNDNFTTVHLGMRFRVANKECTSVNIGSNSYITFGPGSTLASGLNATSPPGPKLMIEANDYTMTSLERMDLSAGAVGLRYTGTNGDDDLVWEVVFASSGQLVIYIEKNDIGGGVSGLSDGTTFYRTFATSSGTVVQLSKEDLNNV
uniref:Uncharacterized protein n=2 Tax=Palpitomonas bilix TaxID=652834 RepID=A0A7S3GK76_9EUKA|mmetsp:Transcript_7099/g.18321  ORF Transcript_7099/g.18321 Transcript_7099/m.18321 type:complete len:822 (+) Transcript_7099:401-2866(+)